MPYTLLKTNGQKLTVVQDSTVDTTTDLIFVGKNYTGYGSPVNENFVKLLENFSNSTQPTKPLTGQFWYDSTSQKIKIYNGKRFRSLGFIETGSVAPTSGLTQGDLWYNSKDSKLYVYDTSIGWNQITSGGNYVVGSGGSGSSVEVTDINLISYPIVPVPISGFTATIISTSSFAVNSTESISGYFPRIYSGINLPSTDSRGISSWINSSNIIVGNLLWGTAASALGLVQYNGTNTSLLLPGNFVQKTELASGLSSLSVLDDEGITLGLQKVLKIHVNPSTIANISVINGDSLNFNLNTISGTYTNIISFNGTSGLKVLPNSSLPVSLGDVSRRFDILYVNTVTATTVTSNVIRATEIYDNGSRVLTQATLPPTGVTALAGTANQILVNGLITPTTGSVTLSLPSTVAVTTLSANVLSARGGSAQVTGNWTLSSGTFQASYADLAERYAADTEYEPGTVLVIGGIKEVTVTNKYADTSIAGIVSTSPAYTLNANAGSNNTHPYIALKGRVPCKVRGPINRGELLVTSTIEGYAERSNGTEHPTAVLGRALQNFDGDLGVIEVMVI